MATACSWNPEETTEAAVKERILQPLFKWDGTGSEPTHAPLIRQLMWECVQQYLQDTRNRFDPRLKNVTSLMTMHRRRQNRESFRAKMRPTTPEIDDEQWDPSHSIEDILLQRKKETTPGEYLCPELFTTRKREQQALSINKTGSKAMKGHIQ